MVRHGSNLTSDYSVTVQPAAPEHTRDIILLERQSSTAAHWSEAEYATLFQAEHGREPRLALVALCDLPQRSSGDAPTVVGFLIAGHVAAEWELENIVVPEEARGKGIGTLLMQTFLRHAIHLKSESVFLEVRESNLAARGLYKKVGFKETSRRKSYYTNPLEDAIVYSRDLRKG